jgi:hypothetical protein
MSKVTVLSVEENGKIYQVWPADYRFWLENEEGELVCTIQSNDWNKVEGLIAKAFDQAGEGALIYPHDALAADYLNYLYSDADE